MFPFFQIDRFENNKETRKALMKEPACKMEPKE